MNRVLPSIGRLVADDDGQDLLEYGLLGVLIALVAMVGVTTLGQTIRTVFWEVIGNGF
jgi:Flp pilus assembly pilin Flp